MSNVHEFGRLRPFLSEMDIYIFDVDSREIRSIPGETGIRLCLLNVNSPPR